MNTIFKHDDFSIEEATNSITFKVDSKEYDKLLIKYCAELIDTSGDIFRWKIEKSNKKCIDFINALIEQDITSLYTDTPKNSLAERLAKMTSQVKIDAVGEYPRKVWENRNGLIFTDHTLYSIALYVPKDWNSSKNGLGISHEGTILTNAQMLECFFEKCSFNQGLKQDQLGINKSPGWSMAKTEGNLEFLKKLIGENINGKNAPIDIKTLFTFNVKSNNNKYDYKPKFASPSMQTVEIPGISKSSASEVKMEKTTLENFYDIFKKLEEDDLFLNIKNLSDADKGFMGQKKNVDKAVNEHVEATDAEIVIELIVKDNKIVITRTF